MAGSENRAGGEGRKRDGATGGRDKRQAIFDAAFAIFAERGFDRARLDDVAARAGVAKGTLYLYFPNKEALFEELIRDIVSPLIDMLSAAAARPEMSFDVLLQRLFALFQHEILETDRGYILRLLVAEGPRFPEIARFYHREVVTRGLAILRAAAERAHERGELSGDALARFPQIVFAPLLTALIWQSLFSEMDPLDVEGFLLAHREMITTGKDPSCAPE